MLVNLKLLISTLVIGLCISTSAKANDLPLRFIGAAVIPNDAQQDKAQIGGLSSLGYDASRGELFAVCDDSGLNGGPRVHYFKLALTPDELSINSSRVTYLRGSKGEVIYPERIIDAEGLVILPDGNLLVASEGMDVKGYFALPSKLIFNPEGYYVTDWPVPEKFLPKGKKMVDYGIRPNDAFESLTLSPDNSMMFMANEKAIYQDGEKPDLKTESPVRVITYQKDNDRYSVSAEYVYHISAVPMIGDDPETIGYRSVSDMMALDNNRLVVIEKTFFTNPVTKNSVQLFIAEINDKTTDVKDFDSLLDANYQALTKSLWIDLDQFEGMEGFPNLDNVEGITYGPTLDNGNQTLLLVTDNNFNARQRNLFYAFEILPLD